MSAYANLSTKDNAVTQYNRTGNSNMSNYDAAASDDHVVPDLNQIINF